MQRALLASEGGTGRGHITKLASVARAFKGRLIFDAALSRLEYASEIEPLCDAVYRGAGLGYDRSTRDRAGVGSATYGEFLGDCSFRNATLLKTNIAWWREVITTRGISIVFADFAPCAMLAARSLRIPVVGVATAYSLPPSHLREFPIILPDIAKRIYDEADMVAVINEAGRDLGVPQLDFMPQLFTCDAEFVRSPPLFDPYTEHRTSALMPPLAGLSQDIAGDGDEIFIYFSTTERSNAQLMEALRMLGVPVRLYMPNLDAELAARLHSPKIVFEAQPVSADRIAKRSRMVLHAGQHGTSAMATAAGLPQVAIPQQLEQQFNAERLRDAGVARIVSRKEKAEVFREIILSVYRDDEMASRARAFAPEIRASMEDDAEAIMRTRVAHLLG